MTRRYAYYPIMAAATVPSGHLLQKAVEGLALIDQHKFTARFYIVALNGQLMCFEDSVVFIHGVVYANDANHASQVDNCSYNKGSYQVSLAAKHHGRYQGSYSTHCGYDRLLDELRQASVAEPSARRLRYTCNRHCTNQLTSSYCGSHIPELHHHRAITRIFRPPLRGRPRDGGHTQPCSNYHQIKYFYAASSLVVMFVIKQSASTQRNNQTKMANH